MRLRKGRYENSYLTVSPFGRLKGVSSFPSSFSIMVACPARTTPLMVELERLPMGGGSSWAWRLAFGVRAFGVRRSAFGVRPELHTSTMRTACPTKLVVCRLQAPMASEVGGTKPQMLTTLTSVSARV